MTTMKDAIELANQIKDKKLREKTIQILKNPESSNSDYPYPKANFDEIPAWVGSHHYYKGGELEHTVSVTKLALSIAKHLEQTYDMKINHDHLIAGALLHDIGKVFILKKEGKGWNFTGTFMDHAALSAAELYAREFPEGVIHIVAAHGGDMGQSAANPRTIEATIVVYADVIDAAAETNIHGATSPLQFLLMSGQEEKESEK